MRPEHNPWLDDLNDLVATPTLTLAPVNLGPVSIVVTGPPRSGTTFMLQALQAHLPATVVDHLAASFWRRPAVGVRLSDQMRARSTAPALEPSFESTHGLTPNWYEPHEFSYFWRDALGWPSPHEEPTADVLASTDFAAIGGALTEAAASTHQPLACKGFPLLWCGREFVNACPASILVVMQRDRQALYDSILAARTGTEWFSLRPLGWQQAQSGSVEEQTDFQVDRLTSSAETMLASEHPRIVGVRLEEFVADPAATVRRLDTLVTSVQKQAA